MKTIIQDIYSQTKKESNINKCKNSKKTSYFTETRHIIQIKNHKTGIYYYNKSLDYLRIIVILFYPKFSNHEK